MKAKLTFFPIKIITLTCYITYEKYGQYSNIYNIEDLTIIYLGQGSEHE